MTIQAILPTLRRLTASADPSADVFTVTGLDLTRLVAEAMSAATPAQESASCRYCLDAFTRQVGSAEYFCLACLHGRTAQEREAGYFFTGVLVELLREHGQVSAKRMRKASVYPGPGGAMKRKSSKTLARWWAVVEPKLTRAG